MNKNRDALRNLVPKILANTKFYVEKDRFVEIKKKINEGNFRDWGKRREKKLERKKVRSARKKKTG